VSLPNRVNKIRVRRRVSLFPHMNGDLSAMVGRVHQDVCENISDAAAPRLPFSVLVTEGLREVCDAVQYSSHSLSSFFASVSHSANSDGGHTGTLCGTCFSRSSQTRPAARMCAINCNERLSSSPAARIVFSTSRFAHPS